MNEQSAQLQEWAGNIYQRLIDAYGQPDWRTHNPPVDELVLTILSQNTSDLNSERAFAALRVRYPEWAEVLAAPTAELAETIRAGGLAQQKAPRIQAALRRILAERGQFDLDFLQALPDEEAMAWLTSFPGVGHKTAAIVLLFCFGKPAFPVDTHIKRISRRLGLVDPKASPEQIAHRWEELVPAGWYYALHLNLLKHGRQVCKAPTPRCTACTIRDLCMYPNKTGEG